MSEIDRAFSPADQERILAAVSAAEAHTSGEIVPFVVEASDGYEGSRWTGAALGAVVGALAVGLAQQLGGWWIEPTLAPVVRWTAPPLLGAVLGYLVTAVPALRRALIPATVLERRVGRRAAVAFLDEELFKTRERTGILIFLSLFERRVVVLGDRGINRRVAPEEWERVVEGLVTGIREGRAGAALVAAIGECGELLARRGVEISADDVDELSNELRSSER